MSDNPESRSLAQSIVRHETSKYIMASNTKYPEGSPKEDFNPLDDYLEAQHNVFVESDEHDTESPASSLDVDNANNLDIYGVTPPSNQRESKRNKEKFRSNKSKKANQEFRDHIESQRREKQRDTKRQGVVIQNLREDMASCRLDGEEESLLDVSQTDRQIKRRDSSKSFKTSRGYERDYKNSSGGDLTIETAPTELVRVQSSIKVDSPNRFYSLNSKQVPGLNDEIINDKPLFQRRQISTQVTECPRDRAEFYRIFSQLINMGSEKKKDKEIFHRQLSSEQLMWQNRVNDLIWLELQAWFRDVNIEEQDRYLIATRDGARNILNEIMNFHIDFHKDSSSTHDDNLSPGSPEYGRHPSIDIERSYSAQQLVNLAGILEKHREAMHQVSQILNKLETVENLYPTSKALGLDHPVYKSEDFEMRIKTLYLWLNISKELGHKLNLMARVLYIDQIQDVDWPWLECDSPSLNESEVEEKQQYYSAESLIEAEEEVNAIAGSGHHDGSEKFEPIDSGIDTLVENPNKSVRFDVGSSETSSPSQSEKHPNINLSVPTDSSTPHKHNPLRALSHTSHGSGMSRSSSSMSVEELTHLSIYRYYADRTLKKTGLRKAMGRLKKLFGGTLSRTKMLIEKPHPNNFQDTAGSPDGPQSTKSFRQFLTSNAMFRDHLDFGEGDEETQDDVFDDLQGKFLFEEMGLPSFQPIYLFLVRISLDVVHECLKLRLEQQPEEPSMLSVKQLIRECKEVLLASVMVKQYYLSMISNVLEESYEAELESFEEDFKKMLETYFKYIQLWMTGLMSSPEMSKRLKNVLEEEWNFTKLVCVYVRGGEAHAGNWFCVMASSLLRSITDFLENGMDEEINSLYDSTLGDSCEDLEQLQRRNSRSLELRHAINKSCRNFKRLFQESRERASKALGFAKKLRKDLEIAADFNISVTANELLDTLRETDHVQVVAPQSSGYLMFIPENIGQNRNLIIQFLNVTCGREDSSHASGDEDGYLLLVKCAGAVDSNDQCPFWKGKKVYVDTTAETTIALSHIEVEGLLLVVLQSSQLYTQRKHFEQLVGPVVQLVHENTSCHQAIAESLQELKNSGLYLRERITDAIAQVDEKLNLDDISEMDEIEKMGMQKLIRETLHQCYNFGFEYHKEVTRLVTGEARAKVAGTLVEFAKQWMKFVTEKCERGRGLRPRWAGQGLEFLIHACEPKVLATLTEEEFTELKSAINRSICHVIGEKGVGGSPGTSSRRISSPDVKSQRHGILRNVSCPSEPRQRSPSTRSTHSEPGAFHHSVSITSIGSNLSSSPSNHSMEPGSPKGMRRRSNTKIELIEGADGGIIMEVVDTGSEEKTPDEEPGRRMERINKVLAELESRRNNNLIENQVIGRVTGKKVEVDYRINIRRVNFKWQRGIKVGEGQFGKVYTAVNTDTGDLMAMKELRFQPNDYQAVKDIADEITILAELDHQSLIKYYGVEVHRDEMLLFMEYCSEGTVADASRLGLSEEMIRKYTCEILYAISFLHDKQVVHRDIKGANIFLTPHGLKLGDFGCAVKLKSHTTLPGEFKTMAGTTAYMAPEVVTSNTQEGHGRAADIWSLGCVVIEMTTGKRPWHELENNFMIMFKVGMGGTPPIPESLSEEGQDFLEHCLEHDPKQRWTASELLDHPFVKVSREDDGETNA